MNKKKIFLDGKNNISSQKDSLKILKEIKNIAKIAKRKNIKLDFIFCVPSFFVENLSSKNKEKNIEICFSDFGYKNFLKDEEKNQKDLIKNCPASNFLLENISREKIFEKEEENIFQKIEALAKINKNIFFTLIEEKRDEKGLFLDHLKNKIFKYLKNLEQKDTNKINILYKHKLDTKNQNGEINVDILEVEKTVIFIRKVLIKKFGQSGKKVNIFYDGFLDEKNIVKLWKIKDLDGFVFDLSCEKSFDFQKISKIK